MRRRDTSEKAASIQAGLNRALGPAGRFVQAMELSDFLRELAKAGLRARHPDLAETDLVRMLTIQLHGVPSRK